MSNLPRVPRVSAVMLVDGRAEMVKRAVRCFEAQTYQNRELIVLDTGAPYFGSSGECAVCDATAKFGGVHWREPKGLRTVGRLRNCAIAFSTADIICHWDSDDWSAPERITEQVALLTSSDVLETVGYNDMLFWVSARQRNPAGAWLYSGAPRYMLGTSLCYWQRTWERKPFPDKNSGEDTTWQIGLKSYATVSSLAPRNPGVGSPRMIASIHGGNISSHVDRRTPQWKRVPEWDKHCAEVIKL